MIPRARFEAELGNIGMWWKMFFINPRGIIRYVIRSHLGFRFVM